MYTYIFICWVSLVAQMLKNLLAMWEKEMATHSSVLPWRIPWIYSPWGCTELDTTERLSLVCFKNSFYKERKMRFNYNECKIYHHRKPWLKGTRNQTITSHYSNKCYYQRTERHLELGFIQSYQIKILRCCFHS